MTKTRSPSPPSAGPGAAAPVASPIAPCPAGCPGSVTFHQLGGKWGWDDFTDPAVPWMSIQNGKSDTALAKAVTNGARMCNVTYESSNTAAVTVSPARGTSDNQTLTLTGTGVGEATITAKCGGAAIGTFKVVSYNLVTKTVAVRLVNETGYASTDVGDAVIRAYLKKVYDQGVVSFVVTRLPAKTVAFDHNGDSKVDVNSWMSAEMATIRNTCKDDTYNYNIFLVNKSSDNSAGFMSFNNPYGFVHPDTGTARKTIAHELGHGAFGLSHTDAAPDLDLDNIMYSDYSDTKWKLRKAQWDAMH